MHWSMQIAELIFSRPTIELIYFTESTRLTHVVDVPVQDSSLGNKKA